MTKIADFKLRTIQFMKLVISDLKECYNKKVNNGYKWGTEVMLLF